MPEPTDAPGPRPRESAPPAPPAASAPPAARSMGAVVDNAVGKAGNLAENQVADAAAQAPADEARVEHDLCAAGRMYDSPAWLDAHSKDVAVRRPLLAALIGASLLVPLALCWEFAARRGLIDPFFVSQPSAVVMQLYDWWQGATSRGPLTLHVAATLGEAAVGLVCGSVLGVLLAKAFPAGTLRGDVASLLIGAFKPATLIGLAAVCAIGLGLGMASHAALAAALTGSAAFADGRARRPALLTLRARCGVALLGAVIGECLGGRVGLGFLVVRSLRQFNANGIYAALVVLVVLAFAVDALAGLAQTAWRRRAARAGAGPRAGQMR